MIRRVRVGFGMVSLFVLSRLPIILAFVVGFYFTLDLVRRPLEDTTAITNVAFGIVASLAALSFGCARAIPGPPEEKDLFAFAGERFFHAGLLLLVASALKYTIIDMVTNDWITVSGSQGGWRSFLKNAPGQLVTLMFFWALVSAHGGLVVANRLLWKRHHRFPDWDDFA